MTAQSAAIYVKPNDDFEFARAIVDLMDDAERRTAMGVLGRRRMEEELAWPHSVPRLLKAYRAALSLPRKRWVPVDPARRRPNHRGARTQPSKDRVG